MKRESAKNSGNVKQTFCKLQWLVVGVGKDEDSTGGISGEDGEVMPLLLDIS